MQFFDTDTVNAIIDDDVSVVNENNRHRVDTAEHYNLVHMAIDYEATKIFNRAVERYPELLEKKDRKGRYALQIARDNFFDAILELKPKNLQQQIDTCIGDDPYFVSLLLQRHLFSESAVKKLYQNRKDRFAAEIREYYPDLIKEKLSGYDLLNESIRTNDLETFRRVIQEVEVSEVTLRQLIHKGRTELILILAELHPQLALDIFKLGTDQDENEMLQALPEDFYDQLATYYPQQTDQQYEEMMSYIYNNFGFALPSGELVQKIMPGIASVYKIDKLIEYLDNILEAQREEWETENQQRVALGMEPQEFTMDPNLQLAYTVVLNTEAAEGNSGFDAKLQEFLKAGKITREKAKEMLTFWSGEKRKLLLARRFDPKERRPDGSFYQRTD
jgi:hypothetical protein